MALQTSVSVGITSSVADTVGLASLTSTVSKTERDTLSTSDLLYSTTGTISGAVSYDFAGTLTDAGRETAVFSTIELVYFKNNSTTNAMQLGGANNIPFLSGTTDKINVPAGAKIVLFGPFTVTAGTGDLLTVSGTDTDTFDLIVIGTA